MSAMGRFWMMMLIAGLYTVIALKCARSDEYDHVAKRLKERGISPEFVSKLIAATDTSNQSRIIRSNVFGFRSKVDYSGHLSPEAKLKCREFMRKNAGALSRAQRKYGVEREYVTALLWVETRHGRRLGSHPVTNVYMNLAMADYPEILEENLQELRKNMGADQSEYPMQASKLREASVRKAEWALEQLAALEKIHGKRGDDVFTIHGSYAGAFGIAQFIPSSYLEWAVGDLFRPEDAVLSVAHYLKRHGWGKSAKSRRKALFAYNKSQAYVNTIVTLAGRLRSNGGKRVLASKRE